MQIDFNNTEIAFAYKNNFQLKKAYRIFRLIDNNFLVKYGSKATNLALKLGFPIKLIIKATIFEQFCGGENVKDCAHRINQLGKFNVGTILDYSVEGKDDEAEFNKTVLEIKKTIDSARLNKNIPFSVFKITGIASYSVLKAANISIDGLSLDQEKEYEKVLKRVDDICRCAHTNQVPIFIDAEDSWFQGAIDRIVEVMMNKYNQEQVIVYTTIQFYRFDRVEYLKYLHKQSENLNYKLGVKLVRGAYMEKERSRAKEKGYKDPIHVTKKDTDSDYNLALNYCIENIDKISICAGTHNENSSSLLVNLMKSAGLKNDDKRIYFAQLIGMSDHISFNLSKSGYNVAKYVPYGPVNEVMPYLFRRAEENTSVSGQTGRELALIKSELKRRKVYFI